MFQRMCKVCLWFRVFSIPSAMLIFQNSINNHIHIWMVGGNRLSSPTCCYECVLGRSKGVKTNRHNVFGNLCSDLFAIYDFVYRFRELSYTNDMDNFRISCAIVIKTNYIFGGPRTMSRNLSHVDVQLVWE